MIFTPPLNSKSEAYLGFEIRYNMFLYLKGLKNHILLKMECLYFQCKYEIFMDIKLSQLVSLQPPEVQGNMVPNFEATIWFRLEFGEK